MQLLHKLSFPFASRPDIDLLNIILTDFLEQSPYWEANSCSSGQDISRILNGTQNFISVCTKPRYLYLSWAISIQSTLSHLSSLKHGLVLLSHLRLYLPSRLFPLGFSTKLLYAFLLFHFIILTSPLRWSLSNMFPHQMLFHRPIYSLTIRPTCPTNRNRVFTTRSRSVLNRIAIRYPLFPFVLLCLGRNMFVDTLALHSVCITTTKSVTTL